MQFYLLKAQKPCLKPTYMILILHKINTTLLKDATKVSK